MIANLCTPAKSKATSINKFIIGAVGLAVIIATSLLVKVPGDTIVRYEFQNAAHTLAFSLITFLTLIGQQPRSMRSPVNAGLLISACILVLGLVIECAQWLIGRGFSPLDLARNLVGVCIGGALYVAWISTIKRRLAALVIAALLLTASYVPTAAFMISARLTPASPTLADFEQWGVTHRIRSTGAVTRIDNNAALWPANTSKSARVQFQPDIEWPSVLFAEVNPDWSSYHQLRFRVVNPQSTSLALYIRVDDLDLGSETENRITLSRTVIPGESEITIPLAEFRQKALQGNYSGQPLMRRMDSFVFFLARQDESVTLLFDDVELTNPRGK